MKFLTNENDIYEDIVVLTSYNGVDYEIKREKYHRKFGYELLREVKDKLSTNSFISPEDKEEYERQAQSRAKSKIRDICLSNDFTHFFTITCDGSKMDRFSIEETQDNLKKTFKSIKRKYKDFKYICVTETHKDGAFHFHGLCKGLSTENGGLFVNKDGYLQNQEVFDKMGRICTFMPIYLEDKYSYNKLVSYITKYISKDCVKLSSYYFRSKDLVLSSKKQISLEEFYKIMGQDYQFNFDNKFVSISEYKFDSLDCNMQLNIRELEEKSKFMKKL